MRARARVVTLCRTRPAAAACAPQVFFYGGSFSYGGASFPLYDGETDVALMKDVILVATNYRLNAFGFLAGDLLKRESTDGSVGNYGFQDQVAALKVRAGAPAPRALSSPRDPPTRVTPLPA